MRDNGAGSSSIGGIISAGSQIGVSTHRDCHTDLQVAHLAGLPIDFNVGELINLVSLGHPHIGFVSYRLAIARSRSLGVGNGDGRIGDCGDSGFGDLDGLFPAVVLGMRRSRKTNVYG